MFFQIGFAIFLVLNTYTYLRIRSIIRGRRGRIILTAGYVLLVLSFPLIEVLAHSAAAGRVHSLLLAGYLTLPLMLYLFLTVLALDLLKGLNRLLKIVAPEDVAGHRGRRIQLGILVVLPVAIVIGGLINNATLCVNEYAVDIPRRSSHRDKIRIALASDFHLREMTGGTFLPAFVDRVNSLNADLVLIPGDIVEGDRSGESLEASQREFRRIHTTWGVFATLGNHESYGRADRQGFFRNSGITLLQDTAVLIDSAVVLVGRNDSHDQRRRSAGELVGELPVLLPVIVMDHKPTDIQKTSQSGADILVSGHTHYGQLWPINYITDRIYDLDWGYKKVGPTHVFVTCGVQVWGPPVRTAGVSEIMLITAHLQ